MAKARARFDFVGEGEGELSFKQNDVLDITNQVCNKNKGIPAHWDLIPRKGIGALQSTHTSLCESHR
jgi:hypothetical protein